MTMTLSPTAILTYGTLAAAVLFFALWVVGRKRKNYGTVDVGWTAGVGLMAVFCALVGGGWPLRRLLVGLMGGIWAFRLAYYIVVDRVLTPQEDGRYQRLRAHWAEMADGYFLLFFMAQTFLVTLFALPFLPLARDPAVGLRSWEVAGACLWLLAFVGESVADRQLVRFRRNPDNRGKTCRQGLWRYSRHPNYFCEWLHWWAYVLFGLGTAGWALTLVGPVLMLVFLFRLTGIPYTEQQALASRGDDYRRYQRSTSVFFPWPPRREDP
jgi:steroid 5-alpha reductase family enzyme